MTIVYLLIGFGILSLVAYLSYRYPGFRRMLAISFNWILFVLIPALFRGVIWLLREIGRLIADVFRFIGRSIRTILRDNTLTIVTGVFLILILGFIAYKSMLNEYGLEERMKTIFPYGVTVVIIAISTIAWTRK